MFSRINRRKEFAQKLEMMLIIGIILVLIAMVLNFRFLWTSLSVFSIFVVLLIGTLLLLGMMVKRVNPYVLAYVGSFMYIAALTSLSFLTGGLGAHSEMIYPLIVIVTTSLLGFKAGLLAATISVIFFVSIVGFDFFGMIGSHLPVKTASISGENVYKITILFTIMCYVSAVICGYFYKMIEQKDCQLGSFKKELELWNEELAKRVEERTKELEEVQNRLIEAERLASLGELSAGIAHEIGKPLTVIETAVQRLQDKLSDNDPRRELTSLVLERSKQMGQFMYELFNLARPSNPKFTKEKMSSVIEIMEKTLRFLKGRFIELNVKVVKNYDIGSATVWIDSVQIQQVFLNVLVNALESMPHGGTVTVSTIIDESVVIKISDTGKGISESDKKRLFSPFFTTKKDGVGLGLSVCQRIIQRHDASLTVDSELGQGTTFSIKLPMLIES